jgi:hypothetical protein
MISHPLEQSIFCFVFTGAKDPAGIVAIERHSSKLSHFFSLSGIKQLVQQQCAGRFFFIQNFDVLIRPDSNFSRVPALLHPFAIVFSPLEFWFDEKGFPTRKKSKSKNKPNIFLDLSFKP